MTVALAPGAMFAGYRIESIVGRGGMGVVYRARDLSLGRTVALKLIAPEFAEDEGFRRRFLRESRLAASLEHPNVVPIHEAGEQDGQLYLAMRYVEGSDLRTLLKRESTLAPERSLALLAQIADALDAAHRRGLVHRDVKPANVLIDGDGHAYLTDFGVSKQLGGASTESGQLVGTLDYLAPEQIRGDPVDARADVYALACVLYQCLAGAAPFHRASEAETLWAHMQEEPPQLPHHPALTPVLRNGLAKDRDDRYAICVELIDDARAALARGRVPRALLRRPHAILAAGLLVLAAAATAAVVTISKDDGPRPPPARNGIAALDATGRLDSFTESGTAPSNVAVGEGAVWALNTEDKTVSRIDPETKQVAERFEAAGRPSDLAVGAGAVWVGNSGGRSPYYTVSISRLEPNSGEITRTEPLPTKRGYVGLPRPGFPGIAVGGRGVWAINPDGTVSRIDPKTGRHVATIAGDATTIAAGEEGVWFLRPDRPAMTRIDPRTNTIAETIRVGSNYLSGIAVGGGSVWATSEEGRLWRVEPGRPAITSTIDVGVGVSYVAFGDGAVWAANYFDGTVSRVDPRTNKVTRVPVGASQALAAGAGAAWASVAAGAEDGTLPAPTCGEIASGGEKPDVLIASDLPLQGPNGAVPRALADAIRFVLKDHGFRAGRHAVGYQSCDDSTAQTGGYEQRKCAANANAYARAERLVAVIGPYNSGCARVEIPILNMAPGGPLAIISPTTTFPNLTRGGRLSLPPPLGLAGEPQVYYPTGMRNFARVVARDDRQGVALAVLAKQLRLDGVYLLYDSVEAANVSWTGPFRRAAARLGVVVEGSDAFEPSLAKYNAIADKVAASGAEGVLIGGNVAFGGGNLLKALRARLGQNATIMAGDNFQPIPDVLEIAGPAARGLYVATSDLTGAAGPTAAAERFTRDFGAAANENYALHAAQATEVALEAIGRSDGTRQSVLHELQATRIKDGMLGSFRFDRHGDMTPARITIARVTGSTPATVRLPSILQGAVIDRVVTVPAILEE